MVPLWINFLSANIVFAQLGRIEVLEVRFATPPEVVQQVHFPHSRHGETFVIDFTSNHVQKHVQKLKCILLDLVISFRTL